MNKNKTKSNRDDQELYYQKDTALILSQELKNFNSENNFIYRFNTPQITDKNGIKIKMAPEVEKFSWDLNFIQQILRRRQNTLFSLQSAGFHVISKKYLCRWRFIVGLGASHPQEVSMTLHHIYGFPFIPGSAIKGVTRHWIALNNISDPDVEVIFGTQKSKGKVFFFDAFPAGKINLKLDIMNPHFPRYYSGEKEPADWQAPTPIKFLTVEKTEYEFSVVGRDKNLVEKTFFFLKQALQKHGLGAKTSLGYGIFQTEGGT